MMRGKKMLSLLALAIGICATTTETGAAPACAATPTVEWGSETFEGACGWGRRQWVTSFWEARDIAYAEAWAKANEWQETLPPHAFVNIEFDSMVSGDPENEWVPVVWRVTLSYHTLW